MYWIWLSRVKYVGPVLQKNLISQFSTPQAVFEADEESLSAVPKITRNALKSLVSNRCLKEAENIVQAAEKSKVRILTFNNRHYPQFAKACRESPIVLYYRGQFRERPLENAVGIVGARRCSAYGRKIAERLGEELALKSIPVISGFAKGIDSYAQAACHQNGGYTIAFLGCGPDICYPSEQRTLYYKMIENGGLFISAFPPGTKPLPKHFLSRNALISAWSTELIIVEAGETSGALTTVEFALKNHKPVYAVPNQIDNPEGVGTNRLLANGVPPFLGMHSLQASINNGAKVEHNNFVEKEPHKDENSILQNISSASPTTIHLLSRSMNLGLEELMEKLIDLELERKIIIRGNVIYKQ